MDLREKLVSRIRGLDSELAKLADTLEKQRARVQETMQTIEKRSALRDELAAFLGDQTDVSSVAVSKTTSPLIRRKSNGELKPGSKIFEAKKILEAAGGPLHADEMMIQMGEPGNKRAKLSLVGSLARCVKAGQIFVRTAPNTFGLLGRDDRPSGEDGKSEGEATPNSDISE